jgi:hypothetical protein
MALTPSSIYKNWFDLSLCHTKTGPVSPSGR